MSSPTASTLVRLGRRVLGSRQLDHLARFEPVLAAALAGTGPSGTLLDVGSGSQGIASLLPSGWRATAVDSDFDDYAPSRRPRRLAPDQQIGDVRALDFADGSFDVAVAVDLLEHVPPGDRAQAVAEICRVSRRRAVIACPAGLAALAADRRLADWFRGEGREVPGWLAEHLENGFPEVGPLVAAAAPWGTVHVMGSESIPAHEAIVRAQHRILPGVALRVACRPLERLLTSRRGRARSLVAGLLRRIRGEDREPTYRAILVVDRARAQ